MSAAATAAVSSGEPPANPIAIIAGAVETHSPASAQSRTAWASAEVRGLVDTCGGVLPRGSPSRSRGLMFKPSITAMRSRLPTIQRRLRAVAADTDR